MEVVLQMMQLYVGITDYAGIVQRTEKQVRVLASYQMTYCLFQVIKISKVHIGVIKFHYTDKKRKKSKNPWLSPSNLTNLKTQTQLAVICEENPAEPCGALRLQWGLNCLILFQLYSVSIFFFQKFKKKKKKKKVA